MIQAATFTRRSLLVLGALAAAGCRAGGDGPASYPGIPAPHPGRARSFTRLPGHTNNLVWTVDDGADLESLTAYVALCESSDIALTFCATAKFAENWISLAGRLKALITAGKAQVVNHCYDHISLRPLKAQQVADQIRWNEDWIQSTFQVTSRPYLRPPLGHYDGRIGEIAGGLGFTRVVLWTDSLNDSAPVRPSILRERISKMTRPGSIILGHANAPSIVECFDTVRTVIAQQQLKPLTLDAALGTSRAEG